MAGCDIRRPGESTHTTPTECDHLWLNINHKEYIQSLQENILVNLVDVDFIYTKLKHACDNLHSQLSTINACKAHTWCNILHEHVDLCHAYVQALKKQDTQTQQQVLVNWCHVHDAAHEFLGDSQLWRQHYVCIMQCVLYRCQCVWHLDEEFWSQNSQVSSQLAEHMWSKFS
jgi:hypothetical protein